LSQLVLLDVAQLRLRHPIRNKLSGYLRFAALATKPGEKCGLTARRAGCAPLITISQYSRAEERIVRLNIGGTYWGIWVVGLVRLLWNLLKKWSLKTIIRQISVQIGLCVEQLLESSEAARQKCRAAGFASSFARPWELGVPRGQLLLLDDAICLLHNLGC
jgi:hypothetical protein